MNKIQFIAQTKSHTTREMNSMIVTLGPVSEGRKAFSSIPRGIRLLLLTATIEGLPLGRGCRVARVGVLVHLVFAF